MKYNYTTFRLINQELNPDTNDVQQLLIAGELTLFCSLHFDTDPASDTYMRWICCLDIVSDELDIPERSMTLYPNTLHFEGDDVYVVSITSELDEIGRDDLQNVFITIGVPSDE